MDKVEQDGLLEEAELLLEEAARSFFDGDIGRAVDLAFLAYVRARKVQDANPTREGIRALAARLKYILDALDHFVTTADRDV